MGVLTILCARWETLTASVRHITGSCVCLCFYGTSLCSLWTHFTCTFKGICCTSMFISCRNNIDAITEFDTMQEMDNTDISSITNLWEYEMTRSSIIWYCAETYNKKGRMSVTITFNTLKIHFVFFIDELRVAYHQYSKDTCRWMRDLKRPVGFLYSNHWEHR